MKPLHTSAQRIAYLAKLEREARSDALVASYCGDRKALAQANRQRRRANSALKRIAQLPAPQLLMVCLVLASLTGCATTQHYYSANDYRGVQVGGATITSGVSVGVGPAGVSIEPRVRYYHPRSTPPRRP